MENGYKSEQQTNKLTSCTVPGLRSIKQTTKITINKIQRTPSSLTHHKDSSCSRFLSRSATAKVRYVSCTFFDSVIRFFVLDWFSRWLSDSEQYGLRCWHVFVSVTSFQNDSPCETRSRDPQCGRRQKLQSVFESWLFWCSSHSSWMGTGW